MRRQFYIFFALVLFIIGLILVSLHDKQTFTILVIILTGIALYDFFQKKRAILRNFPILGHLRFILEAIRPEIQQYFIADDLSERPFNRETRTLIYERSKKYRDTVPFGTQLDHHKTGYEWILHSISPKSIEEIDPRVTVGGSRCTQPYSASRLNISAMSFGSLSPNAIMALNKAAEIGDFAQNTGEGGISEYHLKGGDLIFQIGTAYFGCRNDKGEFDEQEFSVEANRAQVKMIEIKISQGAKPAHGGILPAAKLTAEIARIRKVPLGHDVVSPPGHTAFSTPLELLYFIDKLRNLSQGKPVGFKLCVGRKSQFLGICKAMLSTKIYPDFITVDGGEGGTGAAPLEFSNHMGSPLNEGLAFIHNALVGTHLRQHIRLIAAGKIATGFDMLTKFALGADICNAGRSMMMAVGCIQAKQCHTNTCPTGVATQDPYLGRGLVVSAKKIQAANFHHETLKSFLSLVGAMGFADASDIDPKLIMRRVNNTTAQSYHKIYKFIEPGSLLAGEIPSHFAEHWEHANQAHF